MTEVRIHLRVRQSFATLLFLLLACAAPGENPAPTSPPPPSPPRSKAQIVAPQRLDLVLRPDLSATTTVDVQWEGAAPAQAAPIQFNLAVARNGKPCKAVVTNLLPNAVLNAKTSTGIPIEIVGCSSGIGETNGFLGISIDPDDHKIPVKLTLASSRWLTVVVYFTLALSLLVVGYGAVVIKEHGHKFGDSIGGTFWDFSSSWATNITAFGTAFMLLLNLAIFPDKPILGPKSEYTFLALFAGSLVGLAPAVQRMFDKTDVDASTGTSVLVTHGVTKGFLTSSAFTMWGAYLQIGMVTLVVIELEQAGILSCMTAYPIGICIVLVGIGLAFYCWWKILVIIGKNASKTGTVSVTKGNARPMFATPSPTPAEAATGRIPLL
jgi:hypothetical protein